MKQINRWGISAGLVALVGMAVFASSCSDDKKGATGVGGSASTGGATSDTGGADGVGGESATGGRTSASTTAATGGGGNDQDSGTVYGCTDTNTDVARSDGMIADFSGSGTTGIQAEGGIATYGGTAAPAAEIVDGTLHITLDKPQTTGDQYVGTVLYFDDCIDASAFKGVEFTISGTLSSACTVQYSTNHSAANDMTTDPKGVCALSSCYSPQKGLTLTDTETVVQVPWAGATGGSPAIPVDPTKLTGIQWQLTIKSGTGDCEADITIKNVKFFN